MASNPYNLVRAKRSLWHFLIGRGASAFLGVAIFILTVRLLSRPDYGLFIAAMALVQIYYLLTGFGLSTVAQRYVADARISCAESVFSRFVWRAIMLRFVLAAVPAVPLYLVTAPLLDLPLPFTDAVILIVLLILGAMAGFFEEVMGTLLLQGSIQIVNLARSIIKIAYLFSVSGAGRSVSLTEVLLLEAVSTLAAALIAFAYLGNYLGYQPAPDEGRYRPETMWATSRKLYVVQIVGQAYGPNMFKLVSNKLLGLTATASLGFAQSLVDMIHNYLPSRLLVTWIRPLMISRYLQSGRISDLADIGNTIFKLSFLTLLPFTVFFMLHGDAFADLVSRGKYSDQRWLLLVLVLYCLLQTLHLVLQLITLTIERADGNVTGAILACLSIPVAAAGALWFGLMGLALGMVVSELIWNGYVMWHLRRTGITLELDFPGFVRLAAVGAISLGVLMPVWHPEPEIGSTTVAFALSCLTVAGVASLLQPFRPAERELIGKLMPLRYFPW